MLMETWLAFAAASIVLLIIPGPTVVLTVSYAISQGRRAALSVALGVALGDLVAMTASLLGLGALVLASATLFALLKWIGAIYLIWLGITLWRSPPVLPEVGPSPDKPASRMFWHAALVTSLNPKSITFFIAFVPQFLNVNAPLISQFAIMIVTFVGLAFANALGYLTLADQARHRLLKPGFATLSGRIGGGALITMGIMTAMVKRG